MKPTVRLAALALVLSCCATFASAQPKAALVQDRDEPARNPYQQLRQVKQDSTHCGPLITLCSFDFDTVPAGKRLVVTHVSVILHTDPSTGEPLAYAGPAQIPNFAHWLPLPQSAGGTQHITAGAVLFYVEAGSYPYVIVTASLLTDGRTASASISGYYVNVP